MNATKAKATLSESIKSELLAMNLRMIEMRERFKAIKEEISNGDVKPDTYQRSVMDNLGYSIGQTINGLALLAE